MNLIFLFRRLVYAQVLLGIVAFCMAENNPGLLLVAGALGALSWYVVEGPTGRPLPHWMIIIGAMFSVAWLLMDLARQHGEIIIAMGHFTMWLQVLLLYGNKSNREYGEILVLSLLQMIGASVLSISIVYGALLVAYCVLSLFTVLVFQLKSTSDLILETNQAAAPAGAVVMRPKAVVGRGHRRHFRAVTVGVGFFCGAVAVAVFLFMPRGSSSRISPFLLNPLTEQQAGFNNVVQLGNGAPTGGNRDPVLRVVISVDGKTQQDEDAGWLLRGAALERYDAFTHLWTRGPGSSGGGDRETPVAPGGTELVAPPADTPVVEMAITQRSSTQRCLFTLFPVTWVQSTDLPNVVFNARDRQLSSPRELITGTLRYRVRAPLLDTDRWPRRAAPMPAPPAIDFAGVSRPENAAYARGWGVDVERIRAFATAALKARRLERDPAVAVDPRDPQIAEALTDYLRASCTYSLNAKPVGAGVDPISNFLFVTRQGHCELFASALAAMARSIGMRSRVVTGFRVSEYNHVGGYYIVRQNHAHAWTEVLCGTLGWRTFDATPADAVASEHHLDRGWFTPLRELYDHVEFAWASSVVSYDQDTRERVVGTVGQSFEDGFHAQWTRLARVTAWITDALNNFQFDGFVLTLICSTLFFIVVAILSLIHLVLSRHRRLVALQLTALPRAKRRGLVKQLGFYLTMLEMLERHGHVRPAWQSPFSFAQALAESQPKRFDAVVSLTELFYEIRFGYRQIDKDRRKNIASYLSQLSQALAKKSAA